jgi:hypothetical protein
MRLQNLDPPDDDLAPLLDAERRRPSPAPDVRARVHGRVAASIGPGGGGSPRGGQGPAAPPGAGLGALAKPILLGAALGGLVSGVLLTRPEPAPALRAAAATASGIAVAPPIQAPPRASAEPALPEPPAAPGPAPAPSASATRGDESLADERRVLEEALRALAEGRSGAALEAVGRHERDFPRGRLAEEREGLRIRALARAGRLDEARARAARFRERFPRSILLPAIESSVGTIP